MQEGAGNGNTLCLAFGQAAAHLATGRIQPHRHVIDKEGVHRLQRLPHVLLRGGRPRQL